MQSRQALNLAKEAGLDLVLVTATAQPPVARITDYGKYKYMTEKREKENKKQKQELKGIKMSPRIAENDVQTLLSKTRKFLEEGHKIRVVCQFKAREITHPEIGHQKMIRFAEALSELSVIERPPLLEGRQMIMILNPKPNVPGKSNAKDQNKQDGREEVQDHGLGEDNSTEERE